MTFDDDYISIFYNIKILCILSIFQRKYKLINVKTLQINTLNERIISSEKIIKHQSRELEILRKRLLINDQHTEENLSELNVSEHEMLTVLYDRIHSLRILLQEKSENMVKLQADYELLKVGRYLY